MEQFEPNDLLIFARVAELGSFTRAAGRLGLPKSTVSRRISLLEERLGERLMVRTTRRLKLTEFGERLLEHARHVAAEVDEVTSLAEHRKDRPVGRLRAAMPSDLAILLLADALAAFTALHPAVSLELDLSARQVDLLGENVDVAVRIGSLPDDALLAARRIGVFPVGLYASPSYLAERGEPTHPDDLGRHDALRLLGRDGEPAGWKLLRGEQRWEGALTGRASANSPELLIRLARSGAGIAAVPDIFAIPSVRRGELRRVLSAWCLPSHTVWAVFPGRRLMPTKVRAFLDMLTTALASVPPPQVPPSPT
jgi:DNA-binding transcriptional LysR family regulator